MYLTTTRNARRINLGYIFEAQVLTLEVAKTTLLHADYQITRVLTPKRSDSGATGMLPEKDGFTVVREQLGKGELRRSIAPGIPKKKHR